MALPTVADSLAGRMDALTLLPLSQSEMLGRKANWIEAAFSGQLLARTTARRRAAWARQYMDAIIQRDVRDVADIEKLQQLPRFLNALALASGRCAIPLNWECKCAWMAKLW
jgi:predicted AAA+ superfamily ATPase